MKLVLKVRTIFFIFALHSFPEFTLMKNGFLFNTYRKNKFRKPSPQTLDCAHHRLLCGSRISACALYPFINEMHGSNIFFYVCILYRWSWRKFCRNIKLFICIICDKNMLLLWKTHIVYYTLLRCFAYVLNILFVQYYFVLVCYGLLQKHRQIIKLTDAQKGLIISLRFEANKSLEATAELNGLE